MSCYPCTRCNKCGMYSAQVRVVCADCGTPVPAGTRACPECGCSRVRQELVKGEGAQSDNAQ